VELADRTGGRDEFAQQPEARRSQLTAQNKSRLCGVPRSIEVRIRCLFTPLVRLTSPAHAHERVSSCAWLLSDEVPVEENQKREEFDTGLARIRHEIKGRLVPHGFFGSVTYKDVEAADHVLSGSKIEITVNGRTVERSFSRQEIEACRLRVGGAVLLGVISMVDDLSA